MGGLLSVDVHIEMVEAGQCDKDENGGDGCHEDEPHAGGKTDSGNRPDAGSGGEAEDFMAAFCGKNTSRTQETYTGDHLGSNAAAVSGEPV